MPVKDAPVKRAIEEVIGCRRKGRKKVIAMLKRTHAFSSSKIRRVYQQNGYSLFQRPTKRTPKINAIPATVPLVANKEWAIDFMHDALANGRQIRSLNIIDPFNRECKGMFIKHSIPASRLIEAMEQTIEVHGQPEIIRTDGGPELISKRFQKWLHDKGIKWIRIRPGNPQENCFIERFNRTAREELFDAHLFFTLEEANKLAGEFMQEYNCARPHESLNNKTPMEYAA